MTAPVVLDHPLVAHFLASLRDKNTDSAAFRAAARRLTQVLVIEATRDLMTKDTPVDTPLTRTTARTLSDRVVIVPILRAGLGMLEPAQDFLPDAAVWHLGLYRDEKTFSPVTYYQKIPAAPAVDVALVIDPMLATGGSASAALEVLSARGVRRLKLLSLIGAPDGVARVQKDFPAAQIFLAALDARLNDTAYIVPGLGDAGDRLFGTV